jgi:hypothetical protein
VRLTVSWGYEHYVVVMDDAIVRVERRSEEEKRQVSSIALAVGWAIGPILAAVADRMGMPGGPTKLYLRHAELPLPSAMRDVATCWAADVPGDLASLPGWPRVESFRPVTFYPRAAIAAVRLTPWRGIELTLQREAAREVTLPVPVWRHRQIREHLRRARYPV